VVTTLFNTVLVVVPIIGLTKLIEGNMASLYLSKGRFWLGLGIGLATFTSFSVTSVAAATNFFVGRDVSYERVLSWVPWIVPFVLSNGVREEVWFRGFFCRGLRPSSEPRRPMCFRRWFSHLVISMCNTRPGSLCFWESRSYWGLGFGAVTQKTGSLLGAVLFHAGADVPVIIGIFSNL